jgi:type IV pilus assembly protein PilP
MEAHLQSCCACTNLVLDARTAEIESHAQAELPSKVLPALSDAISRPRKHSWFEKLASSAFLTLKIVAAPVAVICFMLIIARLDVLDSVHYGIIKKETVEWTRDVPRKISPAPVTEKKRAGLPAADSLQKQVAVNSFSLHEGWSVDPFEPAWGDKSRGAAKPVSKPRTPLEALDPSQLKLVGVMLSDTGDKALVEDASGKGYVIREGAHIGRHAGRVSRILKDRVIIEEEIEDAHGKIVSQKRVLKLNKP